MTVPTFGNPLMVMRTHAKLCADIIAKARLDQHALRAALELAEDAERRAIVELAIWNRALVDAGGEHPVQVPE